MRGIEETSRQQPVLLFKLTPGIEAEAAGLLAPAAIARTMDARIDARQAARSDLLVIRDGRQPDRIALGQRRFDLARPACRAAFCTAIGLAGARARRAGRVLARAPADARDELAQLMRVLCWADQGRVVLRRVVISGHFAPGGVRGNDPELDDPRPHNGTITSELLAAVTALFPHAAAQVEHLMLALCFGGEAELAGFSTPLEQYRGAFPRLRSVTAYRDKAPRAGPAAARDLRAWERATRGGEVPGRDRIFGRCRVPRSAAEARRAGGVVISAAGAERCGEV